MERVPDDTAVRTIERNGTTRDTTAGEERAAFDAALADLISATCPECGRPAAVHDDGICPPDTTAADLLDSWADALDANGAAPFRARTYRRAARVVRAAA